MAYFPSIAIGVPFFRNIGVVISLFIWGTPTIKNWGETTTETWG